MYTPTPKPGFEELKRMSLEKQQAFIKTCSKTELLALLNSGLAGLLKQVEQIPELIYDRMDKELANHKASRREADALLARLRPPR